MPGTLSTEARSELRIEGMTCASCVAHVTRALERVPGVADAQVNLATESAVVAHRPDLSIAELIAAVESAGYRAHPLGPEIPEDATRERDLLRERLVLATGIVLTAVVMALAMIAPPYAWNDAVSFALATIVWGIVGFRFHRGALAQLRYRTANMDTLVSLGSTAALVYSVVASFTGRPPFYDTAAAIVTLVSVGKYLEARARRRSTRALGMLARLRPQRARVRSADGGVREISADDVRVGDVLVVAPGERIPVDGVVLEGSGTVDASVVTGEAMPVEMEPGRRVAQGMLNGDAVLIVRAESVGAGSTVARIMEIVRQAQGSMPRVQRLADRAAGIFVPVILAISAVTYTGWLVLAHAPFEGFMAAVATLVVACPCALGLATPVAIAVAVGLAARNGILFKDADALERLAHVTEVIFDKTGTLTEGKPQVLAVRPVGDSTEEEVLANAAAVESASTHPLARAVTAAAQVRGLAIPPSRDGEVRRGAGVCATVGDATVIVGSRRYLEDHGVPPAAFDLLGVQAHPAATVIYVARNARLLGALELGDAVRPQAREAVARLGALGVTVHLASGDAPPAVEAAAREAGIEEIHAACVPEEKARLVQSLRSEGRSVAFVGDGINDAPALAVADVGIAMGAGSEAALETAGAAILSGDLLAVPAAIVVARATMRTIVQNLWWAFGYNAVLVPLAAFGIVRPILAAGAMGFSSLFVVANALLLRRRV
jgi:Cu+-exporting ATPase